MSRRRDCPPTRKGRSHRCASVPRCSSSRLGSLRPCSASTPTGRKPAGSWHEPVTNRGGRRRRGLPLSTPGDRSGTRNPAQTAPPPWCHNRGQASRRERDTSGMTADRHHERGWDIAHRVGVPHAPPSVIRHPAHRVAYRLIQSGRLRSTLTPLVDVAVVLAAVSSIASPRCRSRSSAFRGGERSRQAQSCATARCSSDWRLPHRA